MSANGAPADTATDGRIPTGQVRTVLGDVSLRRGVALVHEHISCDLSARSGPEFLLTDVDLAEAELRQAAEHGVTLILDTGNTGHRRDPFFLRSCSTATGLSLIASTGHYRSGFFPREIEDLGVEELAAAMVEEIQHGIAGSGIRAGAIAEIGFTAEEPTVEESKVMRAAGMAQAATGAPLLTHTPEGLGWAAQLRFLRESGADLERVVIGHMDCIDDPSAHRAVIDAGAWLGFDRVGLTAMQSDEVRIRLLAGLERDGYLTRVLLSQDIATKERYRRSGAPGYAGIITHFMPRLEQGGLSAHAIDQLVYQNPWTFLLS